jgi:hypothetical protein
MMTALACAGSAVVVAACDGQMTTTVSSTADAGATPIVLATSDIEAGRYLVLVGGCNDCHTPQYAT